MKELEVARPLIIEDEPSKELEEEPQVDQVTTRSTFWSNEDGKERMIWRIRFKCRSEPYEAPAPKKTSQ